MHQSMPQIECGVSHLQIHTLMKTIIVATDFSTESKNAARYAAQLALATGSKLLLLHTTQFSVVNDSLLDVKETLKRMNDEGESEMRHLEEALKSKFEGLKLEKSIREGFTLDVLKELVAAYNVSMVVFSIRNTDNLYEAIFGSTALTVAGSLMCPVLIIPENARFRELKKIAFAFDQKNIPTGTGLHVLAELKKTYDASMRYVNVLEGIIPQEDDSSLKPVYKILNDKEPRIQFLMQGTRSVPEILTDYVRSHKPNMLVMVSRKRSLFWKIFGTRNTKQIAFNTTVPLLVLSESGNN